MEQEVRKLLYSKCVFENYKGFDYFIRAVSLALENPERLVYIREKIYAPIAAEFNQNISSVEKDLRTVRDVFMKNNGAELLAEMGGGTFWKESIPYPKDMIAIFSFYLRNNNPEAK